MNSSSKNVKALKAGTNITHNDDNASDDGTVNWGTIAKSTVGFSNVDDTADSAKVVSGPQLIALNQREYAITTTAPLRKDQSLLNNATTLSIDPMAHGHRRRVGGKWDSHYAGRQVSWDRRGHQASLLH